MKRKQLSLFLVFLLLFLFFSIDAFAYVEYSKVTHAHENLRKTITWFSIFSIIFWTARTLFKPCDWITFFYLLLFLPYAFVGNSVLYKLYVFCILCLSFVIIPFILFILHKKNKIKENRLKKTFLLWFFLLLPFSLLLLAWYIKTI